MAVGVAVNILWVGWYLTWVAAVVWSARTAVQMRTDMCGLHRAFFTFGLLLLVFPGSWAGGGWFTRPLWSEPRWVAWSLFALVVASFAFCWWARVHLGRLWSGFVTLKEGHHIVDTGPYGLVRHPIYSGIIAAAAATALIKASPAAIIGVVFTTVGLAMVARIEERFLRGQLGAEAYDAYSRRVAMLAPKLR